jgi:dephospho-CoA kinase
MVFAPLDVRIARVLQRDNISRAEFDGRNSKQYPDKKKLEMADYVITNDDTKLVVPQVLDLHREFLKLSQTL